MSSIIPTFVIHGISSSPMASIPLKNSQHAGGAVAQAHQAWLFEHDKHFRSSIAYLAELNSYSTSYESILHHVEEGNKRLGQLGQVAASDPSKANQKVSLLPEHHARYVNHVRLTPIPSIIIYGGNSAGKSTFGNQMIGVQVLKASAGHTTSRPTVIRYHPTSYRVRKLTPDQYAESTGQELCQEFGADVEKLTAFLHNPQNNLHSRESNWKLYIIEISGPFPVLKHGLQIIDLPGHSTTDTKEVQDGLSQFLKIHPPIGVIFCYQNASFGDSESLAYSHIMDLLPSSPPIKFFFLHTKFMLPKTNELIIQLQKRTNPIAIDRALSELKKTWNQDMEPVFDQLQKRLSTMQARHSIGDSKTADASPYFGCFTIQSIVRKASAPEYISAFWRQFYGRALEKVFNYTYVVQSTRYHNALEYILHASTSAFSAIINRIAETNQDKDQKAAKQVDQVVIPQLMTSYATKIKELTQKITQSISDSFSSSSNIMSISSDARYCSLENKDWNEFDSIEDSQFMSTNGATPLPSSKSDIEYFPDGATVMTIDDQKRYQKYRQDDAAKRMKADLDNQDANIKALRLFKTRMFSSIVTHIFGHAATDLLATMRPCLSLQELRKTDLISDPRIIEDALKSFLLSRNIDLDPIHQASSPYIACVDQLGQLLSALIKSTIENALATCWSNEDVSTFLDEVPIMPEKMGPDWRASAVGLLRQVLILSSNKFSILVSSNLNESIARVFKHIQTFISHQLQTFRFIAASPPKEKSLTLLKVQLSRILTHCFCDISIVRNLVQPSWDRTKRPKRLEEGHVVAFAIKIDYGGKPYWDKYIDLSSRNQSNDEVDFGFELYYYRLLEQRKYGGKSPLAPKCVFKIAVNPESGVGRKVAHNYIPNADERIELHSILPHCADVKSLIAADKKSQLKPMECGKLATTFLGRLIALNDSIMSCGELNPKSAYAIADSTQGLYDILPVSFFSINAQIGRNNADIASKIQKVNDQLFDQTMDANVVTGTTVKNGKRIVVDDHIVRMLVCLDPAIRGNVKKANVATAIQTCHWSSILKPCLDKMESARPSLEGVRNSIIDWMTKYDEVHHDSNEISTFADLVTYMPPSGHNRASEESYNPSISGQFILPGGPFSPSSSAYSQNNNNNYSINQKQPNKNSNHNPPTPVAVNPAVVPSKPSASPLQQQHPKVAYQQQQQQQQLSTPNVPSINRPITQSGSSNVPLPAFMAPQQAVTSKQDPNSIISPVPGNFVPVSRTESSPLSTVQQSPQQHPLAKSYIDIVPISSHSPPPFAYTSPGSETNPFWIPSYSGKRSAAAPLPFDSNSLRKMRHSESAPAELSKPPASSPPPQLPQGIIDNQPISPAPFTVVPTKAGSGGPAPSTAPAPKQSSINAVPPNYLAHNSPVPLGTPAYLPDRPGHSKQQPMMTILDPVPTVLPGTPVTKDPSLPAPSPVKLTTNYVPENIKSKDRKSSDPAAQKVALSSPLKKPINYNPHGPIAQKESAVKTPSPSIQGGAKKSPSMSNEPENQNCSMTAAPKKTPSVYVPPSPLSSAMNSDPASGPARNLPFIPSVQNQIVFSQSTASQSVGSGPNNAFQVANGSNQPIIGSPSPVSSLPKAASNSGRVDSINPDVASSLLPQEQHFDVNLAPTTFSNYYGNPQSQNLLGVPDLAVESIERLPSIGIVPVAQQPSIHISSVPPAIEDTSSISHYDTASYLLGKKAPGHKFLQWPPALLDVRHHPSAQLYLLSIPSGANTNLAITCIGHSFSEDLRSEIAELVELFEVSVDKSQMEVAEFHYVLVPYYEGGLDDNMILVPIPCDSDCQE